MLDNVHDEPSVNLLFLEFSSLLPCSIWGWMYRMAIQFIKLDWVQHNFDRTNVVIPHLLKQFKHVHARVALRYIVVQDLQLLILIHVRILV